MATTTFFPTVASGSGATDAISTLLTSGYARSGIAVAHSKSYVDGFANLANWKLTAATAAPAGTVEGGALTFNAAGTATLTSISFTDPGGVGTVGEAPRLVSVDGVTPLWMGMYIKIGTVGTGASGFLLNGFRDPANNKGFQAGYFSASSTTKFAAWRFDGVNQDTALSTVSIDSAWHKLELWIDGTNGYQFSVDNETAVGVANGTHTISGSAATIRLDNSMGTGGAGFKTGAIAAIWGTPY